MDNDSLENYWDEVDAVSWEKFDPNIGDADRGLDACGIECNHMISKEVITIDFIVIDTVYKHRDIKVI